jgi:hypothetical protein
MGTESPKSTIAMKASARSKFVGEVGIGIPFDTIRRTAKNATTEAPKTTAITELAFVGFIFAAKPGF